jgi:hypothetical protein
MKFSGSVIDLSARFTHRTSGGPSSPAPRSETEVSGPGRPWSLDARFDRALIANGRQISGIFLRADNDGAVIRHLKLTGQLGGNSALELAIEPTPAGRHLSGRAADAGGLLAGFDVTTSMESGRLELSGDYDDDQPDHPLSGTATIDAFRFRNVPGIAKLLQGMTLYGLVDALSGPGLNFTRLVAPFRLTYDALEVTDARAFSSSLGLTMKGRFDLVHDQLDLRGTVVPAYMFNSLLGRVPVLGRLFSPEKGGGLFAADYAIVGSFADPRVSVNPLSALTPGALRGLFGIF